MTNIAKINETLDEEIEKTGKNYLTPPEANKILEGKKLLNNSIAHPGLPLRRLLRQGKIPHAYQIGGKGSKWRIPHSNPKNSTLLNHSPIKKNNEIRKSTITQENGLIEVRNKIEEAQEKYKPKKIKYLLIAEAPPENLDRFFYYSDVRKADCLFLGIMEALYPSEKQHLLQRNPDLKEKLLLKFMGEGFYLIDLFDFPRSFYSKISSEITDHLIKKVKQLSTIETKVIIIKADVYDAVYSILSQNRINVIDKKIYFPSCSRQPEFQKQFKEALQEAGYLFNIKNS